MRGRQFLAYLFNFIPLLQREMCIAWWYFLLWYGTGCCTGQACFLQCAFSCVLQMLYTLFGVQFSVTDWQFENFNYFARVFSGNLLTGRFLQLKTTAWGVPLQYLCNFAGGFPKLETNLQILFLKLQIHTYDWAYSAPLSLGKECQCAGMSAFAQYPLANFE
jgi:hypothetical protein